MSRAALKNWLSQLLPPIAIRGCRVLLGQIPASELLRPGPLDETSVWYCPILGGWLTPESGNLRLMALAIELMPEGGSVLEIGSFLGQSTNLLLHLLRKYGRNQPLYSCDPWIFDGDPNAPGAEVFLRPGFAEYAKETFIRNCRFFSRGQEPRTFDAPSDDFFVSWRDSSQREDVFQRTHQLGGPISFAYIDGLHTEAGTRSDFENVDTWLLPGGFVLLDDTGYDTSYPGTRAFALSLRDRPDYEVVRTFPNFLVRKKPR